MDGTALSQARKLVDRGCWVEAGRAYAIVLDDDPNSIEARLGVARGLEASGSVAPAAEMFARIATDAREDAQALAHVADFYVRQGQFNTAEKYLRLVAAFLPGDVNAARRLGRCLLDGGKTAAGSQELRRALALDPADVQARVDLGVALADGGQPGEAERVLKDGLLLKGDDPLLLGNLGVLFAMRGEWEQAADLYLQSLRLDDSLTVRLNLATAHLRLGHYERALADFERVTASDPRNADAHRGLALALEGLGRFDQAVRAFETSLELRENKAIESEMAYSLVQVGRAEEGITRATRVLDPMRPESFGHLARALGAADRLDEAILAAREGVRLMPSDPSTADLLAYLLSLREDIAPR